jgi:hypothetical protein
LPQSSCVGDVHCETLNISPGISVSIVDRLRPERPEFDFPKCRIYFLVTASRPALLPSKPPARVSFTRVNRLAMTLTDYLNQVARLRMHGAVPPVPMRLHGTDLR